MDPPASTLRHQVALAARLHDAGPLDRLLLAAGGWRWLQRRFERTLTALAARFGFLSLVIFAIRLGQPRTVLPQRARRRDSGSRWRAP
jgi:hypothetical protein